MTTPLFDDSINKLQKITKPIGSRDDPHVVVAKMEQSGDRPQRKALFRFSKEQPLSWFRASPIKNTVNNTTNNIIKYCICSLQVPAEADTQHIAQQHTPWRTSNINNNSPSTKRTRTSHTLYVKDQGRYLVVARRNAARVMAKESRNAYLAMGQESSIRISRGPTHLDLLRKQHINHRKHQRLLFQR